MSLCHLCLDHGEKVKSRRFELADGRVLGICPSCFQYLDGRGLIAAEVYGGYNE